MPVTGSCFFFLPFITLLDKYGLQHWHVQESSSAAAHAMFDCTGVHVTNIMDMKQLLVYTSHQTCLILLVYWS